MTDLFGGTLPITLAAQLAEVERELAMRHRVYPRWTATGRILKVTADRQLATMEAVAETLRGLKCSPNSPDDVPIIQSV